MMRNVMTTLNCPAVIPVSNLKGGRRGGRGR